jgi:hypothetical protein
MELWAALFTAPWVDEDGPRVATIERHLATMGIGLPLGPVYFQRVNRLVADLAECHILKARGADRARQYSLTPEGFVAVVLNMSATFADPTVEGIEFELKRVIAETQAALAGLFTAPEDVEIPPRLAKFFSDVDEVELLGKRVMSRDVAIEAFSIHALVERQIRHVRRLHAAADAQVHQARAAATIEADPRALEEAFRVAFGTPELRLSADTLRMAVQVARSPAATSAAEANALRYVHELAYLEELARHYARTAPDVRAIVPPPKPKPKTRTRAKRTS